MNEEAHIAAAQIYTGSEGGVLDLFVLQDEDGRMFGLGESSRLKRLQKKVLDAVLKGVGDVRERKSINARREAAFVVEPDVIFDNSGSAEYTIIEVTGKERAALLYDLARTLANKELKLHSAHAGAYGERIHDTFYVQTAAGEKLTEQALVDTLATDLLDVLGADEQTAPRTPAHTLAQARSADSF